MAGRMGLAWRASSRGLAVEQNTVGAIAASAIRALKTMGVGAQDAFDRAPAQAIAQDFERAARIVALKKVEHLPLLQEQFPAWAEKVEYWNVDDTPEAPGRIESEVAGLVARIIGGGERVENAASASKETERPVAKAPKPLTVKVGRETAGRRGKGVTTVFDIPAGEAAIRELAATLKQKCGTGGTVKDGRIEIQGDQRERIVVELEKLGYKVKRAGG